MLPFIVQKLLQFDRTFYTSPLASYIWGYSITFPLVKGEVEIIHWLVWLIACMQCNPTYIAVLYCTFHLLHLRSTWLHLPLKRASRCATTDCGGIFFLTAVKLWGSNVFRSVTWNLSSITSHSMDLHWSIVFVFLSRGDAGCVVGRDKFLPK
jgi:hypothetical protein